MKLTPEQILEIFNFRHACKKFDGRPLPEAEWNTILEAGRLSPSSFGYEPWHFVVVQKRELLEKLYPWTWGGQRTLYNASHLLIILARRQRDLQPDSQYLGHMMRDVLGLTPELCQAREERYATWQERDFDLTQERPVFDWACKQSYIALANMMTVAASLGVDSCPIEGFKRTEVERILQEEGILEPQHFGVAVMATFGYRAEAPHRPKTRQSLGEITPWVR